MSINERIIAAVKQVILTCVPEPYDPDSGEAASEYCTFSYSEQPDGFGDDAPEVIRYLIRVIYHAPLRRSSGESNNTLPTRKALRQAIFAAGFTYPSVENLTDEAGQRFAFEFEGFDGEV